VCVQVVCEQVVCVQVVCEQVRGGGGRRRRAGGGRDAEPKTRTPHKDVGKKTSSSVRPVDFSKGPDADLVKRRCRLLPQAKFGEGVLGLAPCHFDWKINEETAQACQRDVSFDITQTWCRLRWHTNQSRTCAP